MIEIAETLEQKAKGLGERDFLDEDKGMLFDLRDVKNYEFWMGGMEFPLDFIWLKDGLVFHIHENVPVYDDSGEYTRNIRPEGSVDYVLEVNAGFVQSNEIKIGDSSDIILVD